MSSTLVPCSHCSRHVRAAESACPFCAAPMVHTVARGPSGGQAARVVVALAAALTASASLAACYGGPPHPHAYTPRPSSNAAAPDGAAVTAPKP